LFLENARGLAGTWQSWYPELKRVEIHAPTARAAAPTGRHAQFFSGGGDSWFTLLRHTESAGRFPQVGTVDHRVPGVGFDIPLDLPTEFQQLSQSVEEIADRYGKRHIDVTTNLRQRMTDTWHDVWGPRWGPLTHGAALAATALVLGQRHTQVRIASTHCF